MEDPAHCSQMCQLCATVHGLFPLVLTESIEADLITNCFVCFKLKSET